jgi:hypothetical protein
LVLFLNSKLRTDSSLLKKRVKLPCTQTSMPRVGFKATTPVLQWVKTVHALDRMTTVIGPSYVCWVLNTWHSMPGQGHFVFKSLVGSHSASLNSVLDFVYIHAPLCTLIPVHILCVTLTLH